MLPLHVLYPFRKQSNMAKHLPRSVQFKYTVVNSTIREYSPRNKDVIYPSIFLYTRKPLQKDLPRLNFSSDIFVRAQLWRNSKSSSQSGSLSTLQLKKCRLF